MLYIYVLYISIHYSKGRNKNKKKKYKNIDYLLNYKEFKFALLDDGL